MGALKKLGIALGLSLGFVGSVVGQSPATIYVDANKNWTSSTRPSSSEIGTSWAYAYDSLHNALAAASAGDSIFVRSGGGRTYVPNTKGLADARRATFSIPNGVKVYGGFSSDTQTTLGDRPIDFTSTFLIGNIAGGQRVAHVVTIPTGATGVLLNGFTIYFGSATIGASFDSYDYRGGGVLALGVVRLENVNISRNTAGVGGGIYTLVSGTELVNCKIFGNTAQNVQSLPAIGGGVYAERAIRIENCEIYNNTSAKDAGGIYGFNTTIIHTTIRNNTATDGGGGGAFLVRGSATDVVFKDNSAASGKGGGAWIAGTWVSHCVFKSNTAWQGGGVALHKDRESHLYHSYVLDNTASSQGGGIYVPRGNVVNNVIETNTVNGGHGGGIYMDSYSVSVGTVDFVRILNNTIYHNLASGNNSNGGGLYVGGASLGVNSRASSVVNNILFRNNAGSQGEEVYNASGSYANPPGTPAKPEVVGIHFAHNYVNKKTGDIVHAPAVNSGNNRRTAAKMQMTNNVLSNRYPFFVWSPGQPQHLRLSQGSLALNAGDGCFERSGAGGVRYILRSLLYDLNGVFTRVSSDVVRDADGIRNYRRRGTAMDIGAYEAEESYAVIYVNAARAGLSPQNGLSWETAYDNLHKVFAPVCHSGNVLKPGDSVWMAKGTYVPNVDESADDVRTATFSLPSHIALYGGFAGTESRLSERNLTGDNAQPTILSGDIGQAITKSPTESDYFEDEGFDDNLYHVLSIPSGRTRVLVDGVTIQGAYSSSARADVPQGALLVQGAASLHNITLRYNKADQVSALWATDGEFLNANIHDNSGGSAVRLRTSKLLNSLVHANTGLGVDVRQEGVLANSAVYGNTSAGTAGVQLRSSGQVINSTLHNNTAQTLGVGGLEVLAPNDAIVANTLLYANTPAGAIYANKQLLYSNQSADGALLISHSYIKGKASGIHVQNSSEGYPQPRLLDLVDSDESPFTSQLASESGYLRLHNYSTAINAGDNTYLTDLPSVDAAGATRIQHTTVDAGAYESTNPPFVLTLSPVSPGRAAVSPETGDVVIEAGTYPSATNIGSLAHTGGTQGATITYALSSNTTNLIELNSNNLRVKATSFVPYNATPAENLYSVAIEISSNGTHVTTRYFTIQVIPGTGPPTGLSLGALTTGIQLNSAETKYEITGNKSGKLGTLSVASPVGQQISYTLNNKTDVFEVLNSNELHVQSNADVGSLNDEYTLNFNVSYTVKGVQTQATLSLLPFQVVADANTTAPSALVLTNLTTSVTQNVNKYELPKNKLNALGTLSATLPAGETASYTLTSAALTSYSDTFAIEDGKLHVKQSLNGSHIEIGREYALGVRVAYVNANGETISANLTLTLKLKAAVDDLPPSGLTLTPTLGITLNEGVYEVVKDKPIGSLGTLSVNSPTGKTFSYALSTQTYEDTFSITSNTLQLGQLLTGNEIELGRTYTLGITVSYAGTNNTISATLNLALKVVAASEQTLPSGLSLSTLHNDLTNNSGTYDVQKSISSGKLGTLTTSTPTGQTFSYTLRNYTDTFQIANNTTDLHLQTGKGFSNDAVGKTLRLEFSVSYVNELGQTKSKVLSIPLRVVVTTAITGLNFSSPTAGVSAVSNETDVYEILLGKTGSLGTVSATAVSGISALTYALPEQSIKDGNAVNVFGVSGTSLNLVNELGASGTEYVLRLQASYASGVPNRTISATKDITIRVISAPVPSGFTFTPAVGVVLNQGIYEVPMNKTSTLGTLSATAGSETLTYTLESQNAGDNTTDLFEVSGANFNLKSGRALGGVGTNYTLSFKAAYTDALSREQSALLSDVRLRVVSAAETRLPSGLSLTQLTDGVTHNTTDEKYEIVKGKPLGSVGVLATSIPPSVTFTYALTSHTDQFEVKNTHELHLKSSLSAVAANTDYSLALTVTYANELGTSISANLTLPVRVVTGTVVVSPSGLSLTALTVGVAAQSGAYKVIKNKPLGVLGNLATANPTGVATFTYSLIDNGQTNNALDTFSINSDGQLLTKGDWASAPVGKRYQLPIRVSYVNGHNVTTSADLTLRIEVDEAAETALPSGLTLTDLTTPGVEYNSTDQKYEILVAKSAGKLGVLAISSPTGQTFSYSLTSTVFDVQNTNELHLTGTLGDVDTEYTLSLTVAYTNTLDTEISTNLSIVLKVVSGAITTPPSGLTLTSLTAPDVAKSGSNYTVIQNKAIGELGTLVAAAPEGVEFTYSLAPSTQAIKDTFEIRNDDRLFLVESLSSVSVGRRYTLTIKVAYTSGSDEISSNLSLVIEVANPIERTLPSGLSLTALASGIALRNAKYEIPTNQATGKLGELTISSPTGQTFSYSLTSTVFGVQNTDELHLTGTLGAVDTEYPLTLSVSYTNSGNETISANLTLTLKVVTVDAPTGLRLTSLASDVSLDGSVYKVVQNKPIGLLGTLAATAPTDVTFTYSLNPSTQAIKDTFEIRTNNALHLTQSLSSVPVGRRYTLTIKVAYSRGSNEISANLPLVIEVADPIERSLPSGLSLTNLASGIALREAKYEIPSAQATGKLGELAISAPTGQTFNYTLTSTVFGVQNTNELHLTGTLGDVNTEYPLTFSVAYTNSANETISADLTLTLKVVAAVAPDGLRLTNLASDVALAGSVYTVIQNQPTGALGTLLTPRPAGFTFTYSLDPSAQAIKDTFAIRNGNALHLTESLSEVPVGRRYALTVKVAYMSGNNEISADLPLVIRVVAAIERRTPSGLKLNALTPGVRLSGEKYEIAANKPASQLGVLTVTTPTGPSFAYTLNTTSNLFEIRNDNALHLIGVPGDVDTEYPLTFAVAYTNSANETISANLPLTFKVVPEVSLAAPSGLSLSDLVEGVSLNTAEGTYDTKQDVAKAKLGVLTTSSPANTTFSYELKSHTEVFGVNNDNELHLTGTLGNVGRTYALTLGVSYISGVGTRISTDLSLSLRVVAGGTVSVREVLDCRLYPNPSGDILRISDAPVGAKLRILDANGTLVLDTNIYHALHSVNLSTLPTGTYVVEISHQHKSIKHPLIRK